MSEFISLFSEVTKRYILKEPDVSKISSKEELILLGEKDGRRDLDTSPTSNIVTSDIPKKKDEFAEKKYLWILNTEKLPFILEFCEACKSTNRGKASHTNLTGGAKALCGGELWFGSGTNIFINGGSGRYPPETPEQLEMISEALRSAGYDVVNFGWDIELDKPSRYYRG
jgi:hypothetical protein